MNEPQYIFTVVWDNMKSAKVKANHPIEVWGELWPDALPPKGAYIEKVEDNKE